MLVFVDQLNTVKLRKLGLDYDLRDLAVVNDQQLTTDQPRLALEQTGFSLTWQPPRPGQQLLRAVVPPMVLVLVMLCVLIAYVFRFALRSSRTIAANFTALAHTHQALEISEDRFRTVAEATSDWIWETDDACRLTYLSTRFAEVTGYAGEPWLGQPIDSLLQCETTPLPMWLHTLASSPAMTQLRCHYRDAAGQLRYSRLCAAGSPTRPAGMWLSRHGQGHY